MVDHGCYAPDTSYMSYPGDPNCGARGMWGVGVPCGCRSTAAAQAQVQLLQGGSTKAATRLTLPGPPLVCAELDCTYSQNNENRYW